MNFFEIEEEYREKEERKKREKEQKKNKYESELRYLVNSYHYGQNLIRVIPFLFFGLPTLYWLFTLQGLKQAVFIIVTFIIVAYILPNFSIKFQKPLTEQVAYRVSVIMLALVYLHNDKFSDEKSLPKVNYGSNIHIYNEFIQIYPEFVSAKLKRLASLEIPSVCYGWGDEK